MAEPSYVPIVRANRKSGTDFIVRVQLREDARDDARCVIAKWVMRACSAVEPYQESTANNWKCIFDLYDDEKEAGDDDDENEAGDVRMDVLVHNDPFSFLPHSDDGLLILDSEPLRPQIEAADIADQLRIAPPLDGMPHISKVGVSAVTPSVMAKYWWHALRGVHGFKTHPMLRDELKDAVPETSADFGWANYPPTDNDYGYLKWSSWA
jgi:hypothetical protein